MLQAKYGLRAFALRFVRALAQRLHSQNAEVTSHLQTILLLVLLLFLLL
jgi:hypothetical protein